MIYRVVAVLSALAMCCNAIDYSLEYQFANWMVKFGRNYATAEEREYRFGVFQQNLVQIDTDNAKNIAAGGEAVFGPGIFTDFTTEEFSVRLGYRPSVTPRGPSVDVEPFTPQGGAKIWTEYLTPVKNQEQCGSCWAFSATEQIESDWIKAGRKKEILSPQQIVSCDKQDDGCNGGDTVTAWNYVIKAGGIETETHYPYTSGEGRTGKCKVTKNNFEPVANITDYKMVSQSAREESKMIAYVGSTGPLSVCVAASTWMNYNGGVLRQCDNQVDHCVQVGGQNTGAEVPYHIVRNSWGKGWGEEGYIYIEQGKNLCQIASEAAYVTV